MTEFHRRFAKTTALAFEIALGLEGNICNMILHVVAPFFYTSAVLTGPPQADEHRLRPVEVTLLGCISALYVIRCGGRLGHTW